MNGNQATAEFAHDLQTGLARISVPEFERLPFVGMAATLALHIKGLGEIEYPVLKHVADFYFDIPAMVLPQVLYVLEEIRHVGLISEGRTIKKVIPMVPHFASIYQGLGEYVGTIELTEHEQLSIAMLGELAQKAEKKDALFNRLGADKAVFDRVQSVASSGGLIIPKRARGQDILVSPAYFSDNLDALANHAAAGGARSIQRILSVVKEAQGWPLSMVLKTGLLSGQRLTPEELALLRELLSDGVLKPPSIANVANGTSEHFVFTPRPGKQRLDGASREIFERSMALAAAVRKGQLLAKAYAIRSPIALLSKLRDQKWIGASTEAALQYQNLVPLRVGRLEKHGVGHRFVLIDTPENVQAVIGAINLLSGGAPFEPGIVDNARLALQRDETYIQSIAGASKLRGIDRPELNEAGKSEMESLLLGLN